MYECTHITYQCEKKNTKILSFEFATQRTQPSQYYITFIQFSIVSSIDTTEEILLFMIHNAFHIPSIMYINYPSLHASRSSFHIL